MLYDFPDCNYRNEHVKSTVHICAHKNCILLVRRFLRIMVRNTAPDYCRQGLNNHLANLAMAMDTALPLLRLQQHRINFQQLLKLY